jgi:hypothetical protein
LKSFALSRRERGDRKAVGEGVGSAIRWVRDPKSKIENPKSKMVLLV